MSDLKQIINEDIQKKEKPTLTKLLLYDALAPHILATSSRKIGNIVEIIEKENKDDPYIGAALPLGLGLIASITAAPSVAAYTFAALNGHPKYLLIPLITNVVDLAYEMIREYKKRK